MAGMRVQEVMSDDVRTVSPAMPAQQAWALMKTDRIHHLVVVDSRRVVGVLSERDTGRRGGGGARNVQTVQDVMTKPVVTIEHDATVRKAANAMRGRTIGCLPVTKGNRLVGIVTTSDLLDVIGGSQGRPSQVERHALNYKTAHHGHKANTGAW
jgi:acetoin utilization protein AcuB